jgi:amidase
MDRDDPMQLSAVEQAALVRSGEASAAELVEAALAAVERLDPEVNAFTTLCAEQALAEAAAVHARDPRPLCGVPVGIKDFLSAVRGVPTSEGSRGFADWTADHDSAHVRRLRAAGAIVIGRTNTPELALRPVTENARFGTTRNPWNRELAAGGSSGGSAAAVAAGMLSLADGSDLGGSIRIPASCCGVVGLKPTAGRVSIGPDFGDVAAGMPCDGPIARTVLDVATALDVMAGHEPGDRHRAPAALRSFADAAQAEPLRTHIRLALEAPLGVVVDDEPRAAARHAAEALAALGHDVSEGAPGWDDESFPASWATYLTGVAQHLLRVVERLHGCSVDAERLEPATRAWLVESTPIPLVDYLEAGERLWAFARRILSAWGEDEVLVTPTLTRLPTPVGTIRSRAGVTDDALRYSAFVRVWNVTGQPALSLPLGRAADGTPVGVQLVGPPGGEGLLLSLAAQLEQSIGWPGTAPAADRVTL